MGTEQFSKASAANMSLIAFGVLVCALGEANLVYKGLIQQLTALLFEVRKKERFLFIIISSIKKKKMVEIK